MLFRISSSSQTLTAIPASPSAPRRLPIAGRLFSWLLLALALICLASPRAYGDVGVVLNESLDTSVARITGSGHSAVYFSRICPDSPVKLRLCHAGEQGSVMSNYTTLGEDQPFEWNVVPLNIYLYGVENAHYRPIVGSQQIKHVLEERYRENYLDDYCASESCRTSNKAEWREMVGATLARSMYMFVVETTVEQDLHLIEQFNSLPNENHFNGMTRNCADFTRRVINAYFPGATGPDYINDFGMTSPKAIARSFTRYAKRHPEAHFRVLHFAQVPGTIKRSTVARAGTEQLFRSKKLLVPMLIFADHVLPFVAASYIFTGRFNPQSELEKHSDHRSHRTRAPDSSGKCRERRRSALNNSRPLRKKRRAGCWALPRSGRRYRVEFDSVVAEAARGDSIPERSSLNRFFQRLGEAGTPVADHNGALWMEISDGDESSRVGLSASNILQSRLRPGTGLPVGAGAHRARLKEPQTQPREHGGIQEGLGHASVVPSYTASAAANPATPSGSHGGDILLTRK